MTYNEMHEEAKMLVNYIKGSTDLCKSIFLLLTDANKHHSPNLPIIEDFRLITKRVEKFYNSFKEILPSIISEEIYDILNGRHYINGKLEQRDLSALMYCYAKLGNLANRISNEFYDIQPKLFSKVENAFNHLKYSLIVDKGVQKKWQELWNSNGRETDYEDLGRIHFLSHQIWAYKSHSREQRTDSLYKELPENNVYLDQLQNNAKNNAQVIFHSEWKVVRNFQECNKIIDGAKKQIKAYNRGIMLAHELKTCRYIVLVSEKSLKIEHEYLIDEKGNQYKVVNIAIEETSPSRQ